MSRTDPLSVILINDDTREKSKLLSLPEENSNLAESLEDTQLKF